MTKKRQPHVIAARLIVGLHTGKCAGTSQTVASYLHIRQSAANKLLATLYEAGILTRRMERRVAIPPLWVYEVNLDEA